MRSASRVHIPQPTALQATCYMLLRLPGCHIKAPPGGPAPRTCASMTTLCSCSRWMMRSHTAGEGAASRAQFRASGSTAQMGGGAGSLLHERRDGGSRANACATANVQQPRTRNRRKHRSWATTGSAPLLTSCLPCGKAGEMGRFPVGQAFGPGMAEPMPALTCHHKLPQL